MRELGAALMLQDEVLCNGTGDTDVLVYRDITSELDEVFKGISIVKQNEIHFGRHDAREFLLSSELRQRRAWYDVKEAAHAQITEACIFYLSLIQVQRSIVASYVYSPVDLLESPTYIPHYSLCSYAIKYWPRHYKLIPKKVHPTKRALEFCRNAKVMRLLAQAY